MLVLRIRDRLILFPSRSKAINTASAKESHAVPGVNEGQGPAQRYIVYALGLAM